VPLVCYRGIRTSIKLSDAAMWSSTACSFACIGSHVPAGRRAADLSLEEGDSMAEMCVILQSQNDHTPPDTLCGCPCPDYKAHIPAGIDLSNLQSQPCHLAGMKQADCWRLTTVVSALLQARHLAAV